MEHIFNRKLTH